MKTTRTVAFHNNERWSNSLYFTENLCCPGIIPESLTTPTLSVTESPLHSKSPPSSFTPVASLRRHKRCKLESNLRLPSHTLDLTSDNAGHPIESKLLHHSLRYNNSFAPTSTLFSLFLNSPLLPSTHWLYSQLCPNPYSAAQLKNTFEDVTNKEEEERKSTPPESPIRKASPSPTEFCKTTIKNTKQSDVWRPY